MKKIDRLGWAVGLSFVAYGLKIGVRAKNTEAMEQLLPYLPPGWESTGKRIVERLYSVILSPPRPDSSFPNGSLGARGVKHRKSLRFYNLLYSGAGRLARTFKPEELLYAFENDLDLYVAEMARERVFVHAGVVGWNGRAIVIPGRSFTGKSTLVSALVRAGATYYSDEFAVFDDRGRVHPFPKPLNIRVNGKLTGKKQPVETLGGTIGVEPLPVGLVVLTEYHKGARWRPREQSPGKSVLGLLANTVSVRRQPGVALTRMRQVATRARVLKGIRGDAKETAERLLREVES